VLGSKLLSLGDRLAFLEFRDSAGSAVGHKRCWLDVDGLATLFDGTEEALWVRLGFFVFVLIRLHGRHPVFELAVLLGGLGLTRGYIYSCV
jgi:hypothetical protein